MTFDNQVREQYVKFKNINVSFTDTGKGKAVVFLHGFLESKEIWEHFAKQLSKTQRVITIDLLGHGNTDCLSYVHTMEEMAEAVLKVLHYLKLRKYFLIGHSLGGYVSLALAENYPDNIKGLCMFHSSSHADDVQKQKDRDRLIKVVKRNPKIFIDEAIPRLFNTNYQPYQKEIKRLKTIVEATSKQGIIAALEGMKIRLEREIIVKFAPYPVLYIIGEEDTILPCNNLIEQAQLPENGTYLLLKNVGHMGFIEAETETYHAINQFVKKN